MPMNPITRIASQFLPLGTETLDVPIVHPGADPSTVYTVEVRNAAADFQTDFRLRFRADYLDSAGKVGLTGFAGDNSQIFATINENGTIDMVNAQGVRLQRIGSMPRGIYDADPGLLMRADTRTPVVTIEDSGGGKVVRIDVSDRPRLFGKFLITVTATLGALVEWKIFRAYVAAPVDITSGEDLSFDVADPPTVEEVGVPTARVYFSEIDQSGPMLGSDSKWSQLYVHRASATSPTGLNIVRIKINDVDDATLTAYPRDYGEVQACEQADDTVWIGTAFPADLLSLDLVTGTLTNHGTAFAGSGAAVFALRVSSGGAVALGAPGGGVALYRPGIGFTDCGTYTANYAYEVAYDGTYVHAAIRGTTWRWIAYNVETGQVLTLYESADETGFMNVRWEADLEEVHVRYQGSNWRISAGGTREDVDQYTGAAPDLPPAPTVLYDAPSAIEDGSAVTVYYRLSGAPSYSSIAVPITLEPMPTRNVVCVGGKIVGISQSYGAIVLYDPDTDEGSYLALDPDASVGSVAVIDSHRFAMGSYPAGNYAVYDILEPPTSVRATPTTPAVPANDPAANPWRVDHSTLGNDIGGIVVHPDGSATDFQLLQRYTSGVRVNRIADATDPSVFTEEDRPELLHHAASWPFPIDSGAFAGLSTHIKYDDTIGGPRPAQASIYKIHATSRVMTALNPLEGVDNYGLVCEVGSELVGLSYDDSNPANPLTVLFRANKTTGALILKRSYAGTLGAPKPGSEAGIPRRGPSFSLAPDGRVWTASSGPGTDNRTIHAIDPLTLDVEAVATLAGADWVRMAFLEGYAYLTGYERLARIAL